MKERKRDETSLFERPPPKPEIPEKIRLQWQKTVDSMARSAGVRAALIMKAEFPRIVVFVASATTGNPYKRGTGEGLSSGLYCETVMARRRSLLIPNALEDPEWNRNPDLKLGMISYLGFPLEWPDGEIFGTLCVLDDKENHYSEPVREVLENLRKTIESDLESLLETAGSERSPE